MGALPYQIFGTANKDLATSALALLAHAPTGEVRFKGLCKLLNEYHAGSLKQALQRLEDEGLVISRRVRGGLVFGLDAQYGA